jgi:ubiquitin-conjugating enzyme E2 J2
MSNIASGRLRKELIELRKKPIENIRAAPKESNILEWHYVIQGPKGSPYDGGFYHGTVTFPKEYPHKPPSIQMITPNGRFKVSSYPFSVICVI